MKPFMDEDFLLQNDTAKRLYHGYAEHMPIIDYHCHIDPREIAEDRRFDNMTQVWLGGDHYKWRMIRSNGVPEEEITGQADDYTKFLRFAEAMPRAIGNPMYHWTHLELKRYFGYDGVLDGNTAPWVWEHCSARLREPDMSARGLIRRSNVRVIGTTDDPADTLEWHAAIAADPTADFRVVPSFRPDKAVNIHKPGFAEYILRLGQANGVTIRCAADVMQALDRAMDRFGERGCRAADHGLDYVVYCPGTPEQVEDAFARAMAGETLPAVDAERYMTAILLHCGREYARRGWVMQMHFNVVRNASTRRYRQIGPDAGCDCIGDRDSAAALTGLLDALDREDLLPKTVLYSLNPADNALLGSIIGCYQDGGVAGKLQHGSAWWFNDHKIGMREQLTSLANLSLLGNFIGMLTDSRSFLSYTRHEYFRRILCGTVADWVENGEYPADEKTLGALIEDICYNNAKRYFGF